LENASGSQTSHSAPHHANTHNVENYIDLDSIIDNAILYEESEPNNDNDGPTGTTEGNNDQAPSSHTGIPNFTLVM
jgi:hypothetical protein